MGLEWLRVVYASPSEMLDSGAVCLHYVAYTLLGILHCDAHMRYC